MRRATVLLVGLALIAAGCSAASATGPPQINYGRDICIECGMVIDDERFAAAYRLPDGTERLFDDVGGLIIHGRDSGEMAAASVWVHDFESGEWIEAPSAHFVPTLGVTSPMGHGILAFSDLDRATTVAHDLDGEVIGWERVKELPVIDGLLGQHHMPARDDMDHEHDQ